VVSFLPHQNPVQASTPTILATWPSYTILINLITRKSLGEEYRSLSSSLCSFLHLVPIRPKYSPQHPTLKHPQPMFLCLCERPCFTLIHNSRQNYSCPVSTTVHSIYVISAAFHIDMPAVFFVPRLRMSHAALRDSIHNLLSSCA
jgi:hypothetical protein